MGIGYLQYRDQGVSITFAPHHSNRSSTPRISLLRNDLPVRIWWRWIGTSYPTSIGFWDMALCSQIFQGTQYITNKRAKTGLLIKAHCSYSNCIVETTTRITPFQQRISQLAIFLLVLQERLRLQWRLRRKKNRCIIVCWSYFGSDILLYKGQQITPKTQLFGN